MDPLSAVACVVSLADVALRTVSALVEYTKTTQNASTDKALLADEACSLSKSLEKLRNRAQRQDSGLDETWLNERKDLVRQFTRAHEDLAKSLKFDIETSQLKQESRLKTIRTLAKWSFTKSEMTSIMDKELRQAILSWLSPLQMAQIHQTISSRVKEGSGRWFTTSDSFLRWEAGKEKLLWCSGIPGAGKTVIASIAVNHLCHQRALNKSELTVGIAFIYFKYNDPKQTLENVLGSLLKQLSRDQKIIPGAIKGLYDYHRERNTPLSVDEATEALISLAKTYTDLFVIIDALDECSDEVRWGLVDRLRQCQPLIHLMISSRFLDSIDKELEEFERFIIKANKADLELFIDHQISQNKNLRRLIEKSPAMRADIKATVVRTSEDMFLLAQLHVQSLAMAAALSVSHVRKKLQTLPTTLDGTYDEAMRRITAQEPEHQDIALKTLAWVSYAFRSLSLGELQHALAIEPGNTRLDDELLMDGSNITSLCAGLVVIDPATNVVNLVHYTTKIYFENIRLVLFPGFHATITMSCATYLALEELKDASVWQIMRHHPLACYAAQYMGDHARQNPEEALEPLILQNICRLLSNPDKRKPLLSLLDSLDLIKAGFHSLMREAEDEDATLVDAQSSKETSGEPATLSIRTRSESIDLGGEELIANSGGAARNLSEAWDPAGTTHVPEVTALHLAASMGLAKVASMLLSEVPNVDAVDESGKTALAVAMERGFERAVEFLVNSGASVDLGSEHGRGVFLLVNESDWYKVADIVASKAKSMASVKESNVIQLVLAAYHGDSVEIQRLVAQRRIDLESKSSTVGAAALFIAVERNHLQVVRALLDAGVHIDSRDSRGQTSLHRATRRENEAMLRLLLRNEAEVEYKNDDGHTPWSSNLRSRNRHILSILLEAGADPNTKGHQGVSELYEAATHGETDLVELMLESGTNPSIKTQFRWAPLHWAAYYGHMACVTLLLRYGAELSPISDQDATPLDLALRANQIAIVDILTRAGAKESRDIETPTPPQGLKKSATYDDWSAPLPENGEGGTIQVKLSLIFDKPITQGIEVGQFIYPSTVKAPKDYIYHISHLLETSTNVLTIRGAHRRANMVEYPLDPGQFQYDDALYDIVRLTSEYQQLELHPKRQSSLPGKISMHRDWTGSWKTHHIRGSSTEYLFRTTPDWSKMKDEGCRWMTEDGTLLARTGFEGTTPALTLEQGPERQMQDILISCWVAKLWAETVAIQKRVREEV